jgi:hypothetical protein
MGKKSIVIWVFTLVKVLVFSSQLSWGNDITTIPAIELRVMYDDNLDFDRKDEIDDFGINTIPSLALNYQSELLKLSLFGKVDFINYFTETDFDRTNQVYGFDGLYRMSSRWYVTGDFLYRRDESIDSQLEETGRSFGRNRVTTYDTGGGLFYELTELSDIGFDVDYRNRKYSSEEDTDFYRYTFSLPFRKRFANQRDTMTLTPAYTILNSDGEEDVKDYRLGLSWEHLLSETLTSTIDAGIRYTDIEDNQGKNDENIGYFGKLGLAKIGETFSGEIAIMRDIRPDSDGEVVEVNRLLLSFDKKFLERFGFKFSGSGYLTDTESNNADADKVRYFELRNSLYYLITENHSINLTHHYQNEKEFDRPGNPVTQRNRIWLGLELKFPKKWN